MSNLTKFNCYECGKKLQGKEGVVQVEERLARNYPSRLEQWRREDSRCKETAFGWMEDLSAIMDDNRPDVAEWGIYCITCGPQDNLYWFDVGKFNTETKIIDWTLHLLAKGWLDNTDWSSFVRRVLKKNGIESHVA